MLLSMKKIFNKFIWIIWGRSLIFKIVRDKKSVHAVVPLKGPGNNNLSLTWLRRDDYTFLKEVV
jgi:hypothetical protein